MSPTAATTQRLQSAVRDEHIDPSIRGEDEQFQKQYQQYVQHQQPLHPQPQAPMEHQSRSASPEGRYERDEENVSNEETNSAPGPSVAAQNQVRSPTPPSAPVTAAAEADTNSPS